MKRITGSIVALITPFTQDGKVNYEKLGELLQVSPLQCHMRRTLKSADFQ